MDHRTDRRFIALAAALMCAVMLIPCCGDSPTENDSQTDSLGASFSESLLKEVGTHPREGATAGVIFSGQAARKAKELELMWLPETDQARGRFDLDKLHQFLQRESLQLRDLKPEVLKNFVVVEKHVSAAGKCTHLSIRLRGSNSNRRLFLVNGSMTRGVPPGCGSSAIEIATALEVMRVFITDRAMATVEPLPFDLEYVLCFEPAQDVGFVSSLTKNHELIVGVICIEELVSKNPSASNLVVQVVDQEISTLVSALVGSVTHHAGSKRAWQKGTVAADLHAVPESSRKTIEQEMLPYVVIRTATSSRDRTVKNPSGQKVGRYAQVEMDEVHPAVGTADDKLDLITDAQYTSAVAVARAIAIGVTRCRSAFSE